MTATGGPPDLSSVDPRVLQDDRLRILAVLVLAIETGGDSWLDAAAISKTLRDDFGIAIHWRTVAAILNGEKRTVARRRRRGTPEYAIMDEGRTLVGASAATVTFVDPAKAVQVVLGLHALLGLLKGTTIRVCDPYFDASTVEHLDACSPTTTIRLLTANIKDTGQLRQLVSAMRAQGRGLEIRRASSARLHDRYIIDDDSLTILGTSLNGFGKRQAFVTRAGPDLRKGMLTMFDSIWTTAQSW